ncbi:MAG: hypothetical protein GXY17_07830 [Clostridiaceae bacterium]|mgnify:CR=1 FL=1|jgi:hypothetical protein|nr:hypothetical protein [Clostridiaceae bacterium]
MSKNKQYLYHLILLTVYIGLGEIIRESIIKVSRINYTNQYIIIFELVFYFLFGFIIGLPILLNYVKCKKREINKGALAILIPCLSILLLYILTIAGMLNFNITSYIVKSINLVMVLFGYFTTHLYKSTEA